MFGVLSAALGIGKGLYDTITNSRRAREAEDALENYDRQKFQNIADGLSVSTLGADLLREENARISSSNLEALRGAGTRGIIGGSQRVGAETNRMNREIASDLDRQQKQIDEIAARDRATIRSMQEQREIADINALSSQINASRQNAQTGFGNIIQGTGMMGQMLKGAFGGGSPTERTMVSPANTTMVSQGVTEAKPLDINAPLYGSRFGETGSGMFVPRTIPMVNY